MTNRLLLTIASIAGAVALPAPALLAATPIDVPHVNVSYSDLNLETDAGAKALQHRVASAAESLCGAYDRHSLSANAHSSQCRRIALTETQPQVDRAITNARGAQYAQAQGNSNKSFAR